MKKIGFIDYYLDEFHANKYPGWIKQASGGRMEVAYAYGLDNIEGKMSNEAWSKANAIPLLNSIEEVVERSDYIIVLSPDHPEYHGMLSEAPLKSGKPVFIDKTFAKDREAARRMFRLAEHYGTPMYSTSALRFASELASSSSNKETIEAIRSWGPGAYSNYSIHQFEPIVALMGSEPRRIMSVGTENAPALLVDFGGGRQAYMHLIGGDCPFLTAIQYASGAAHVAKVESNFFALFIENLIRFFETGIPPVTSSETMAVITLIEFGAKAMETPFEWIELPI
ncbi:Gfo/Idh/MocA family oxidoreductase [Paenibacillus sp. HB172176]|uniref:Gfo/Idh/MocA family oxidoreductase n=1 Tax=Paenibacillus sp. HB172176 TaxID=2493690 RepID=UPI00143870EB|nr:Gfo/Idh/MocA family oxidoreductase [Paenibacillus sp. HB172176]